MDIRMPRIKGIYRDCLYRADGALLYDSGWKANVIVRQCYKLLAHLMHDGTASDPDHRSGIAYLMVGRGSDDWDREIPVIDVDRTDKLTGPYNKLYVPVLEFIKPDSDPPDHSDYPTNCIQVKVTLGANDPEVAGGQSAYPLREFGLFGRAWRMENDALKAYIYMIDCVRHHLIQKDATMSLTRIIRLTF